MRYYYAERVTDRMSNESIDKFETIVSIIIAYTISMHRFISLIILNDSGVSMVTDAFVTLDRIILLITSL